MSLATLLAVLLVSQQVGAACSACDVWGAAACALMYCRAAAAAAGVAVQAWVAVCQGVGGLTNPVGVGYKPGPWKPDIQMPIPEKTEPTVYMAPYTIYRPKIEFHTKGGSIVLCWSRRGAGPHAAQAAAAPMPMQQHQQ
jgi:hypothetical protein